jgi:hypothetical protein
MGIEDPEAELDRIIAETQRLAESSGPAREQPSESPADEDGESDEGSDEREDGTNLRNGNRTEEESDAA